MYHLFSHYLNAYYTKRLLVKSRIGLTGFALSLGVLMFSCNKAVDNHLMPSGDYGTDTSMVTVRQNKILYIIVDGLRGEAVKTYTPTHLGKIAKQSIYTFNSLNNGAGVAAINWANMLTGVDSSKHQVKTADFAGNDLADYPSIVSRIKQQNTEFTTASFVRSTALDANLLKDAASREVLGSDAAVISSATSALKSADNTLFMVELSSVDSVGKASGYETENIDYQSAVTKVDGYIGNLVTAINSRASYDDENWLIVVASPGGGPVAGLGADTSYYDNPKANGFVYFYNPRFTLNFYAYPGVVKYQGSTPLYTNSSFYAKVETGDDYDITADNEMTISFKMKITALANNSYNPGILKKTESSANSKQGWWFIHNNNTGSVRFVLKGASGSNKTLNNADAPVGTDEWHAYAGKVYFEGAKRYMKMFVDGLPVSADPIDVTGLDCTSSYALDLGQRGSYVSGETKEMVTDVEIYDIALPDDVIAARACKPEVAADDPYYADLIGYWPCTDGNGEKLKDLSLKGNDMSFINKPSTVWNGFNEGSNNVCPAVSADYLAATPKGVDIPYQIYQWLGIQIQPGWKLDGRYWPTGYNNLKDN